MYVCTYSVTVGKIVYQDTDPKKSADHEGCNFSNFILGFSYSFGALLFNVQ